jgi:FtsH-binding integral membrane protein
MAESGSDRMMRLSMRAFSLWLIGVPLALGVLAWAESQDLSFVIGFGGWIVFIGVLLLLSTLSPRRATNAETTSKRMRRNRLFAALAFFGSVPRLFVYPGHPQFLRVLNLVELVLGLAILLWPSGSDRDHPKEAELDRA